jgi:urease accessory protein
MTRSDLSLLRLIQLTDSAFPTGAFAHSFGLETYIAHGMVGTAATLEEFIANTLLHAVATSDGVACKAVYGTEMACEDVVRVLDQRLTAMKTVSEFRAASRALGTRFLHTVTRLYTVPSAVNYLAATETKALYGHLSLAYGLVCRDLALPLQPALMAWFRQYAASSVSVGVRLIPLGQTAGQMLLTRLGTIIVDAVDLALGRNFDAMTSFAPGQELAGMTHRDVLAPRLYIS